MPTGYFSAGRRRRVHARVSPLLYFAIACSSSVRAQEPEQPAAGQSEQGTIVVTGSRIPRPDLAAISPTTVVDGKDVGLQGAITTEGLLNSLPQVTPGQGAFLSNDATGTATVDLRGLGPGRTLVLINGRRLLPGDPFFPVPDINAVPTALIKRVEVLTGGASSVYGSDAVAGVVNFILDTELDGLRVEGQASVFQHNNRDGSDLRQALVRRQFPFPVGNTVDGGAQDINAGYGLSFADGRGHVRRREFYHAQELQRCAAGCARRHQWARRCRDCRYCVACRNRLG